MISNVKGKARIFVPRSEGAGVMYVLQFLS